jgi:hypothetical protein
MMAMAVDLTTQSPSPFGIGSPGLFVLPPNGLNHGCVRYSYGKDVLVALSYEGSGNQIIRSTNRGKNWSVIPEPSTRYWTGLANDGKSRWVAVAQDGAAVGMAMYSADDGVNWTLATMPSANAWQDVCYISGSGGSARFVAVANNGIAATQFAVSIDGGQNWSVSPGGAPSTQTWAAVNNHGNVVVAVSASNVTARSSDGGDNWSAVAASATRSWNGVIYASDIGVWLAVANTASATNVMYSINDALSWVSGTCSTNVPAWRDVSYGNGRFFIVAGNEGSVGLSPDGRLVNHIPDAETTARLYFSCCWARDRFIAVGTYVRIC